MNLESLYNDYSKMVYNLALSYVQNAEDAEEITQDVFVSVYQNLDKFESKAKISTWIYKIGINKSLDYIKAKGRKKRFAFLTSIFSKEDDSVIYEQPNFDHPGVILEQKEAVEHIFNAINQLPENQKSAIILHKIEKLSQQEIADILETTTKAVESLVQRAKKNLKKLLDQTKD